MTKCYRCLEENPAEVHPCKPTYSKCRICKSSIGYIHEIDDDENIHLRCKYCRAASLHPLIEIWNKANEVL